MFWALLWWLAAWSATLIDWAIRLSGLVWVVRRWRNQPDPTER